MLRKIVLKESEIEIGKVKMKNGLTELVMKNIELKIISKSLNSDPNNHFLRTKIFKLRKAYKSLSRRLKRRYDQQLIKKFQT